MSDGKIQAIGSAAFFIGMGFYLAGYGDYANQGGILTIGIISFTLGGGLASTLALDLKLKKGRFSVTEEFSNISGFAGNRFITDCNL